jgi:hypothetical protein
MLCHHNGEADGPLQNLLENATVQALEIYIFVEIIRTIFIISHLSFFLKFF